MKFFNLPVLALPLALMAGHVHAQDFGAMPVEDTTGRSTFYIGGGNSRNDGEFESDSTPYSIGFMHQVADSKLIFGGDIGREGTLLDSTYRRNDSISQATSFNLLLGANLVDVGRFKTDAALLVGVREEAVDCPDSFLGFQCYANSDPETEYTGNFGAVITLSYDKVSLGVRATSESTQVLAGIRF